MSKGFISRREARRRAGEKSDVTLWRWEKAAVRSTPSKSQLTAAAGQKRVRL